MPRVTVVIPSHDPGPYLRQALDSVVAQTFRDWEAIVVDDGSTEDLSWVTHVDERIRLVRQDNTGVSAARNRGIGQARGEVVALLDADDRWRPEKLARQLEVLDETGAALVSTGFVQIDHLGSAVSGGYEGYSDSYEDLLQGNGICASTVVVRRDVIDEMGGFDPALRLCEDWDLWLRVAHSHRVIKIDDVLAEYRIHPGNASRDYVELRAQSRALLGRHLDAARRAGDRSRVTLARAGRRRIDDLMAHQAVDAARVVRPATVAARLTHLGRAVRWAPGVVAGHALALVRQRVAGLTRRPDDDASP